MSSTCPAPPEVVWEWIADPHRHIRMLPDEIHDGRVLENGDIACELVAMGEREPMVVRVVESDPPRRLVERSASTGTARAPRCSSSSPRATTRPA